MAGFVEVAQVVLEILVPTVAPLSETDPWLWVWCGDDVNEKIGE